jgi:hypothetical protein
MHLNKLSTAALMRLSLLAALNLLLGRFIGYWLMLHPLFFLIVVTLDLGLYAVMVYTGTLNRTLIAMMLAGLAGVLAWIAFAGIGASAFAGYGGRFREIVLGIERLADAATEALRSWGVRIPQKRWWWRNGVEIAYIVVDAIGLVVILGVGWLARVVQARSARREPPTVAPCS